ncbi:hypothetical protein EYZ11_013528 [Aspergillus tanneri]|uniref:Uncharacterized protein n=1 Tax=Aspergillus tanneri TaxID=1220188 RepID=A0A4S3IXF9_9EURO|nr:hypothetical protein EYZ11_013528 [Aspergillus tanneri]
MLSQHHGGYQEGLWDAQCPFNYITQVRPHSVDDLNELRKQIEDLYAYGLAQTEDEIKKQWTWAPCPRTTR